MVVLNNIHAGNQISYDDRLYKNLLEVREKLYKKDRHCIIVIDGAPGVGKSTLAQQISFVIDDKFTQEAPDKIHNTVESFVNYIVTCKKNSAVILDEGLNGANIRRVMSNLNVLLQSVLSEIRQKNLFIIICVPFIFDVDRSIAVGLSDALIHCYEDKWGKRAFRFYGRRRKQQLYLNPNNKKFYSYSTKGNFWGRFSPGYVMNEVQYRKFKADSLKKYISKDGLKPIVSSEDLVKQREGEIYAKLLASGAVKPGTLKRLRIADPATVEKRIEAYTNRITEDTINTEPLILSEKAGKIDET